MIRSFAISIACIIVLLAAGCKSKKEFVKAKKMPLAELLTGMESQQRDYHFFSAKARVKYVGDDMRGSGKANVRMIKDSLIWMNFKKLSIEGARTLIRPDSFYIVYRLEDMYESGTFEELMTAYDLDVTFEELQNIIAGNMPLPTADEVNAFETKDYHQLRFNQGSQYYDYQIDGDLHLLNFSWKDGGMRLVSGALDKYDETHFAQDKTIHAVLEDGTRGELSLSLYDVEFDVPKKIKFEVPSHYRRLP